jgi:xanthine/uracil permease
LLQAKLLTIFRFGLAAQQVIAGQADREESTLSQKDVGLSVAMAMITIVKLDFFGFMPAWSQVVFHSPVIMGALTAICTNAALNVLRGHTGVITAH